MLHLWLFNLLSSPRAPPGRVDASLAALGEMSGAVARLSRWGPVISGLQRGIALRGTLNLQQRILLITQVQDS